ncbi:MAG: acyl-CoA dehydrogenase family protein [Paracoccus sp. (in: a-proteobacteria)]|uniref:acyl-CoA dehydrogenase family protein n=1 Tax=Paracoccus sp. TaxID=267 RepID=UPI0039E3B7AB
MAKPLETPPIDALVDAARRLRVEMGRTAADVDRQGIYPAANMKMIFDAGLGGICLPDHLGGMIGENPLLHWEEITEIFTELATGESSTAQIFNVHRSLCLEMLTGSGLSPERRAGLTQEVLAGTATFCSPAAEPTKVRFSFKTRCTPVDGGVLVNGAKYFATGCEGAAYGVVPMLMDGFETVENGGMHWALVPLDTPGVTRNFDWDNMGQRASGSSSITFENVFIPDGSHWSGSTGRSNPNDPKSISGPAGQILMGAMILGMGIGALDAMCDYVRTRVRPFDPNWKDATEDPIMQFHVGRYSTALNAARSANREAARAVVRFSQYGGKRADVSLAMMQAKVAIVEAALLASGELHRLCGGLSTSNSFRLDRFWRNARTLSTHDSQDVKLRQIGAYVLGGVEPPANFVT